MSQGEGAISQDVTRLPIRGYFSNSIGAVIHGWFLTSWIYNWILILILLAMVNGAGIHGIMQSMPMAWTFTIAAVLLVAVFAVTLYGLPQRHSRGELVLPDSGIEITLHPKWWFRGSHGQIPWENIQTIKAEKLRRGRGSWVPALDIYLYRAQSDLAVFPSRRVDFAPVPALAEPTHRVRVGGGAQRDLVTGLATAIQRVRPELFHRRVLTEHWVILERSGDIAMYDTADGHALPVAADQDTHRPQPRAPITHCGRNSPKARLRALIASAAMILLSPTVSWLSATYLPNLDLLFQFLISLTMTGLILTGIATFIAALVDIQGTRTVIRNEGLEFVARKKHPRRTLHRWISWSQVEAIIARNDAPGPGDRSVELFFHPDSDSWVLALAGLNLDSTVMETPDSEDAASLVSFPAVRLRFRYSAKGERRSRRSAENALRAPHKSHHLPNDQIPSVLLAVRPDLCYGFDSA